MLRVKKFIDGKTLNIATGSDGVAMVSLSDLATAWGVSVSEITHKFYAILGPENHIYRTQIHPNGELVDSIRVDQVSRLAVGLVPVNPDVRGWLTSFLESSLA